MNKALLFFGLVSLLTLGLIAPNSYAASDTIASNGLKNLVGTAVEDSCGKVVGIVDDFMVDSGGHAFAIVNHGDYDLYGDGGVNTLVPLEVLQISSTEGGEQIAFLKTDMEHLDLAPYLDPTKNENPQEIYAYYGIQPSFAESDAASRYYGVQPSWTQDEESQYYEIQPY